jgi:2-C-methyl-D-erythritol 2,4-cyclodiphosphate synthase/2-C-methyl-D-erythritol 4-phosphate cytidylyltransferase
VAVAADDTHWPVVAARLPGDKVIVVLGGSSRHETVRNGLAALAARAAADDWVLVHDAARPCLSCADLCLLLDAAGRASAHDLSGPFHGALLAAPIHDTVKRGPAGVTEATVDRTGLWRALTPQMFEYARLRHALEAAAGDAVTDEAQAMERQGWPARLVAGSPLNIKVTTPEDLALAGTILQGAKSSQPEENAAVRIGQGFDVHAFGDGDHVVLGGVTIAHARGVVAHSDGDVVIHALCDAVLGALGLGDIGQHFPDTDPRYRGADSRVFLREVAARMHAAGLALVNADVTVLAEAPRIAKHRGAMAENLAADLGAPSDRINIKATTTERLGFIGRGEGLAASAAVLLAAPPRR